uniref:Uncharacterized protein n=1 Tax=Nelumbo nucifera TaxID=4432 RepID=A0A822Y4P5_NELNU|nr:TPA_asm: hypothetical protein HUJ06_028885 [Nelumbo nucifera]
MLTSLQSLTFTGCGGLRSFPEDEEWLLPISLKELKFYNFQSLEFLPSICKLTSLKFLEIWLIPKVVSLPDEKLPPQLQSLIFCHCSFLEKTCQKGGRDWPKISHISKIRIY